MWIAPTAKLTESAEYTASIAQVKTDWSLSTLRSSWGRIGGACGGDWTSNTPDVEFPFVQRIYGLYGEKGLVENAHFAKEEHDYGPSKRAALYKFFSTHLQLRDPVWSEAASGLASEDAVTIESHETMQVFNAEHPLPTHAVKPNAMVSFD